MIDNPEYKGTPSLFLTFFADGHIGHWPGDFVRVMWAYVTLKETFFWLPTQNGFLCHTKTGFRSSGHFIRIPTYFFASPSSVARWMDCEANLQPCLQGHVGGQEDCEPWVCGWWQLAPCQNSAGNADHWPLATEGFKVGQRSGPFRFVPDQGCGKVSDVE